MQDEKNGGHVHTFESGGRYYLDGELVSNGSPVRDFIDGKQIDTRETDDPMLWLVSWMIEPETADQKRDYVNFMAPIPFGERLPNWAQMAFARVWEFAVEHCPDFMIHHYVYPAIRHINEAADSGE